MSRTRWILLAIACSLGITPLIASPGSVEAAPGPKSNKPIVVYVDDTFVAPNLTARCEFTVMAHFVGTIRTSVKKSGVQMDQFHIQRNFIGPSGNTLTAMETGPSTFSESISEDGQTIVITITNSGQLPYHMVVPGYGSVANNSGREVIQITLQWDEELDDYMEVDFQVFDPGPNDELSDEDYAAICGYLA